MKKVWSLLCACVMMLTMIPMVSMSVSAAADVVYTIETVTSAPLKAGNTFQVKISTNRISKVCALELHFKYDATKVKAISGTASGWMKELDMSVVNCNPVNPAHGDPKIGEVWLTGMALDDKDSYNGEVIATVTFKALTSITEDLKFTVFGDCLAARSPVESLSASYVNGGLHIVKPAAAKITAESATAAYAAKNQNASVKVTATGDGLSYTWYIKNPGATRYSKSSVTTATYKTKMTEANSGRLVYCIVKDQYGNQMRSKTFVLRMKATITSESATAAYAALGEKASVKVGAAGDGLTYTWYIKNANGTKYTKSSVTSSTYTTAINSTTKGRRVYCVVKDKYGKTAQSKTFILREAVSITTQPKNAYGKNGAKVSATVKAHGDGLTYTWYVKNKGETKYAKSSVTGPTYTTKMSSASKDRLLVCKVRDQYGNNVQAKTVQLKMK